MLATTVFRCGNDSRQPIWMGCGGAFWRRLKGVGLIVEPHIAWQLGQGRIFFWHDCWMGDMTLAQMFLHRKHTSVQGLVPVDVIIQKRILAHMASRCQCCSEIETIQHVFIDSPVAHQVWQHFSAIFGIPLKFVHWRGDIDLAPHFGITLISPTPNPPTLVYWRAPSAGSAKINTDGCINDGFVSSGSVIRDHTGCCIRAFFAGYGDIFILEAELRVILQGIELARRMGLVDLWIETDSTLAVHCISRGGGPWVIQSILRRIRHLLSFDQDTIFYIFREENQVADSLAFEGWDRRHYQEYKPSNLPCRSLGLI
ncbi:Uncharacterized protein Adt_20714 [Abeliophyllum distichum]|uniref:RNase H type-1 domain-containing protein n=1 Tax=Abeliophyllum distichum TaxID=126358 RepID=A0ABD1SXF3_9LAMI